MVKHGFTQVTQDTQTKRFRILHIKTKTYDYQQWLQHLPNRVRRNYKKCKYVEDCTVVAVPHKIKSQTPKAVIVLKKTLKIHQPLEVKSESTVWTTLQDTLYQQNLNIAKTFPRLLQVKLHIGTFKVGNIYGRRKSKQINKRIKKKLNLTQENLLKI